MKDITQRHSRISLIYPKKRPSPHGINKLHKSPVLPHCGPARASRSPRSSKAALMQQRQREAQIIALRREGIWLEEEYCDEIRYYMHDMEVSFDAIAVS
jgi:G2/mitotic-specific cyclin-B, other